MRTYVMTTGALFGLLTFAHLWRMLAAERHLAQDPWYILVTLATAVLCFWAVSLVRRSTRS